MRLPAILTLQMVKVLEVTVSRPLFTKLLLGHSVSPLASHTPRNTSLASICPETVCLATPIRYPRELPAYLTKVRERNVAREKPRTRHVFGDLIVARCACTRGGLCASAAHRARAVLLSAPIQARRAVKPSLLLTDIVMTKGY